MTHNAEKDARRQAAILAVHALEAREADPSVEQYVDAVLSVPDAEKGLHKMSQNQMQNERGEWVPAIPEPLYHRFRAHCSCGVTRWTRGGYREHYALAHILGVGR